MKRIIEYFKNNRKQSYLKTQYKNQYAFVGIGNHSIHNLYPVLQYLRVPIKYIVVNSKKNAELINISFSGIISTNNFETILNDPEINGIFICASPQSHFDLIKKGLEHNKNIFVEKPPCTTENELYELIKLEKESNVFCMVGMQKRYAPVTNLLKNHLHNSVISYNYRFVTGTYPEGDSLLDIFIHPLDFVTYLFGDFEIASIQISQKNSFFIHLAHKSFVGTIELSTLYSWKNAEETLIINTDSGIYKMKNMEYLSFEKKSKTFFTIPVEKIKKIDQQIQILHSRNNFNPIMENNQIVTSGYFSELKTFINLCETGKGNNHSTLSDLKPTYNIIKKIKK